MASSEEQTIRDISSGDDSIDIYYPSNTPSSESISEEMVSSDRPLPGSDRVGASAPTDSSDDTFSPANTPSSESISEERLSSDRAERPLSGSDRAGSDDLGASAPTDSSDDNSWINDSDDMNTSEEDDYLSDESK